MWTIILSVFFFLLLNFAGWFYLENYTLNKGYYIVKKKWDILRHIKKGANWLIVGDSSGNQGVIPDEMEDEFGGTVFNLCTVGDNTALIDSWMIDYHIRKFGPPQNILMVHVYDMWKREPEENLLGRNPLLMAFSKNLKPSLFSKSEKLDLVYNKYFALYNQNVTLKKVIRNSDYWFYQQYHFEENGYQQHNHPYPNNVVKDLGWHLGALRKSEFKLSETNRKALETIKTMAEANHINLYIAHSPVADTLFQQDRYQKYFSQVDSTLQSYANSSPNIHLINSDQMVFGRDEMQNTDHIIHPAAIKYTHHLINEIRLSQK